MPYSSRPVLSDDGGDASTEVSDVFLNDLSDDSSDSKSEPDNSDDSDDETDDDSLVDGEEEQLPPEYFLQEAESLDVSQLRQKRYAPNTQNKLDETWDHWGR
jgi:hypothetical protein